jgi:CBS domain-containing protein
MHLEEVMSQPLVTVPRDATLDQAARLMWEFDCGVIPVLKDDGRLAGVITDRDICMAAYTQGRPLNDIPVTTAMASEVVAAHATDLVENAEELMRGHQIRRLPILDADDRPVGIVSLNDLARLAARAKRSAVDRELVQTLAAVCQPRRPKPEAPLRVVATRPRAAPRISTAG